MAIRKFAGIVDGDVFTVITLDEDYRTVEDPNSGQRLVAGFSSDPKIVEIPSELDVAIGWTWDGEIFINSTNNE